MRLHTFDIALGPIFLKSKLGNLCFFGFVFGKPFLTGFGRLRAAFGRLREDTGGKVKLSPLEWQARGPENVSNVQNKVPNTLGHLAGRRI